MKLSIIKNSYTDIVLLIVITLAGTYMFYSFSMATHIFLSICYFLTCLLFIFFTIICKYLDRVDGKEEFLLALYKANPDNEFNIDTPVVVLYETPKGRNEIFYNPIKGDILSRIQFVDEISKGNYPGYNVINLKGTLTPVARADNFRSNNLG